MGPIGSKRYVNVGCFDMQIDNGGDEGGKPHVILSLRVLDGDDIGTNITSRHYLSPAAAPYTMKALKALGWTGTKISKAMAEGLGTRKAVAQLKVEEYKGKISEKVSGIYEFKARGPKNPIDESNLDAFDALFEDVAASAEGPESALSEVNKVTELPAPVTKKAVKAPVNPNSDLDF